MDFKEIYKTPFKADKIVPQIIYTNDGNRAFDFMDKIPRESRNLVIGILNGNLVFPLDDINYDEHNRIIKYKGIDLLIVKGWENLIGVEGLNLNIIKANKIQDAFGGWIVQQLTNNKKL